MPIVKTAAISPSNACNPAAVNFSFQSANNVVPTDYTVSGTVLTATSPGSYIASANCAGAPFTCTKSAQFNICCFSSVNLPSTVTAITNISVYIPANGTTVNLNTQPAFSFPYAMTVAALNSLSSHYTTWGATGPAVGINGCDVIGYFLRYILDKTGTASLAVYGAGRPLTVTTNVGSFNFSTPSCNPYTLSVSGMATGLSLTSSVTGCTGTPLYMWITPANQILANTANATALTTGTHTLAVLCPTTHQWDSTTVNVV